MFAGVTANGHRQDLTALASVVPVGLVPPGIPEPELLGASGSLDFNDANISLPNLLLLAHAGIYNLSLDLIGFPMVRLRLVNAAARRDCLPDAAAASVAQCYQLVMAGCTCGQSLCSRLFVEHALSVRHNSRTPVLL